MIAGPGKVIAATGDPNCLSVPTSERAPSPLDSLESSGDFILPAAKEFKILLIPVGI